MAARLRRAGCAHVMAGVVAAAIVVSLSMACNGSSAGPGDTMTVRGMVVEVRGKSITELELLAIKDVAGDRWEFHAEGFAGFTPAHLREHQAFGQPVTVTYRETRDGLMVVGLSD